MFGLGKELLKGLLKGEFGGGFRGKQFFLNERLNFQKFNTQISGLVSVLHVASNGWCQSSFISKSSSFEFCEIA